MKKGFTLIEMIAVLTIIGILGLLVSFTVDKTLKQHKQNLYNMQVENILSSAKVWAGHNVFSLPEKEGEYVIKTLQDLQQDGYLENNIENPQTKEIFDPNAWAVKITKIGNSYQYALIEI